MTADGLTCLAYGCAGQAPDYVLGALTIGGVAVATLLLATAFWILFGGGSEWLAHWLGRDDGPGRGPDDDGPVTPTPGPEDHPVDAELAAYFTGRDDALAEMRETVR